jgi:hypothetical protein
LKSSIPENLRKSWSDKEVLKYVSTKFIVIHFHCPRQEQDIEC